MMKQMMLLGISAVSLLLVCGCFTSLVKGEGPQPGQTSKSGKKVAVNVAGSNTGFFLFNWAPIVTGNPDHPNRRDYEFFWNGMTDRDMLPMLKARAKRHGADDIEDVESHDVSTGWMTLWIVWRRVRIMSAVGVVKEAPPKESKSDAVPAEEQKTSE